jgi:AraC-like DNA-binding protein
VVHVEFFHTNHFDFRYHRRKARKSLSHFIDFFWETDFDEVYNKYPDGFSDALFPNVGYTYLINLGTPFVMQLEESSFEMKSDGFLPRHQYITCHHRAGNKIFGIKFNVSPVIFEKKINFSEYREYIFPLAYLIDRKLVESIKAAPDFEKRVAIVSEYYEQIIAKYAGSMKQVEVVTQVLKECVDGKSFHKTVDEFAREHGVSTRTLQRYFEATTSISSKQALQILRIRKALEVLTADPHSFRYEDFGYYDYSHFFKHLRSFLTRHSVELYKPHIALLQKSRKMQEKKEKQ